MSNEDLKLLDIETDWQEFTKVLHENIPQAHILEIKSAFYAGASCAFNIVRGLRDNIHSSDAQKDGFIAYAHGMANRRVLETASEIQAEQTGKRKPETAKLYPVKLIAREPGGEWTRSNRKVPEMTDEIGCDMLSGLRAGTNFKNLIFQMPRVLLMSLRRSRAARCMSTAASYEIVSGPLPEKICDIPIEVVEEYRNIEFITEGILWKQNPRRLSSSGMLWPRPPSRPRNSAT